MLIEKSNTVIELAGVTKAYNIYARSADRVKEAFHPFRKKYHRPFVALKDISFNVKKGETIGIVGRNGSGKSTLLQVMCGVFPPTSGRVHTVGKVAALLELGSGFNPEYTGRENVFLNARILGLTREQTQERMEAIVEFSGIKDFIDQPIKRYSSGMAVRLAFSVMIHVDADILVIDEALAVGDEAFQRKCYGRLGDFIERGNTLVFVSHSAQKVIELCDRALLLDGGRLIIDDVAKDVIREYHRRIYASADAPAKKTKDEASTGGEKGRTDEASGALAVKADTESCLDPKMVSQSILSYEQKGARIDDIRVLDDAGRRVNNLFQGKCYFFAYDVCFETDARNVVFGSMLKSVTGVELGGVLSHPLNSPMPRVSAGTRAGVKLPFFCWLRPGAYFLNAGVTAHDANGERDYLHRVVDALMLRVQPGDGQRFTGFVDFSQSRPPEIRMSVIADT